jgi:hypothetical protein
MYVAFPRSEYYGGSAPSRSHQPTTSLPAATLDARPDGRDQDGSHVHHVPIDGGSVQLFPGSLATSTPQTFLVASSAGINGRHWSRLTIRRFGAHCCPAQIRQVEPVPHLRGFNHWFTRVTHSHLASRARTVWQYRCIPSLSGLLPTLTGVSRIRLPSASPRCCDSPAAAVSHLRSIHMAPHGAP